MSRSYREECEYIVKHSPCSYLIKKGFVPNMKVLNTLLIKHKVQITVNASFVCVNRDILQNTCQLSVLLVHNNNYLYI